MKNIINIILSLIIFPCFGQNTMTINGGNLKVNGNVNIVLNNTNFTNNSTFHAGSGTVIVTGDASTAQSQLGGTSQTTFYNVKINKGTNNVSLGQDVTISSLLLLAGGQLEINNYNLTIGNSGTVSGQNKDRYIKTNGTGFLIRQVDASWTPFPVGKATFNPARLKNDGMLDNYKVRVEDHFLQNGTSGANVTANVIPKTWLIEEETVGGSDVSIQLIWRPSHASGGFDANNATIAHYTGGAWQDLGSGASVSDNSYSSDHRYREASNITNFSPFGARTVSNLPVELLYFYGEQEGQNVRLDWQTATELNNSHFDVEWSTDGISFEKIGEIAGTGTTNEPQFYSFLHDNIGRDVALQRLYYRLKQVDFDGKYEYTNIIQITIQLPIAIGTNNSTIKIFPNPASHYLKIESDPDSYRDSGELVQIFNVHGQLVKEFQHQELITNLPITNLTSGTYFIKIGQQVKKLIVEK